MLVEESRIFQVSTFSTLHIHHSKLNQKDVLLDVMTIADEADAQLAEAVRSFYGSQGSSLEVHPERRFLRKVLIENKRLTDRKLTSNRLSGSLSRNVPTPTDYAHLRSSNCIRADPRKVFKC